jgi:hypothetical protein
MMDNEITGEHMEPAMAAAQFLEFLEEQGGIEIDPEGATIEGLRTLGALVLDDRRPAYKRLKETWDWFMSDDSIADIFLSEDDLEKILDKW